MSKTIGYLRVSTVVQDLEKNKSDILKFSNDRELGKVNFIEEIVSGKVFWRKRKIAGILESLGSDDNIVVSEYPVLVAVCLNVWRFFQLLQKRESTSML